MPYRRYTAQRGQDEGLERERVLGSKRLIVAAIVLPLLFAYIYFLPPFPYFLALLLVVGILAMHEFYVMYKVPQLLYFPGILTGSILLYTFCRHPANSLSGIFLGMFFLLLLRLVLVKTPSKSMSEVGPIGIGFLYISGFLSFQWLLRNDVSGIGYIFLLYTSVWFADSAAYYIGTYLGRNKLYPTISSNKTVEGTVGSVLGGAIGAVIIKIIFNINNLTVMNVILLGAILGIVTVIGDLIESMFKRDAGVKDSSNLIPGHGGILDKIDGLLVAGPILYFILRYF